MGKGKPRTPTTLLAMRGAFRTHPERKAQRKNEPIDIPGIGEPLAYFTADQREAWGWILSRCPEGVLRRSDEIAVEMAARLLAAMRAGTIDRPGLKQLDTLIGKFGMNPSERSKVSAAKNPRANKFASIG